MRLLLAAGLLVFAPLALAQPSPTLPFDEMVAAERAFAARSLEANAKVAFIEWLSPDSLAFQPEPKFAVELQKERPDPPFTLAWAPSLGGISSTGDLGWTTGPWQITADGKPPAGGHFFSIWQRGADGKFRNVLDQGIVHDVLPLTTEVRRVGPVSRVTGARIDAATTNDRLQALVLADRALARDLAGKEGAAAYTALLTDDALMLRNGAGPQAAKDVVLKGVAALPAMELGTVRIAAAGDLAATGGWSGGDSPKSYTRVWRWDGTRWQLAVDVIVERPVPAPKPAS
jgi:hypothetical protein